MCNKSLLDLLSQKEIDLDKVRELIKDLACASGRSDKQIIINVLAKGRTINPVAKQILIEWVGQA